MGKKKKKDKKSKKTKKKKGVLAKAADAVKSLSADGVVEGGVEIGRIATTLAALLVAKESEDEEGEDRQLRDRIEEIVDERIHAAMETDEFRAAVRKAAARPRAARRARPKTAPGTAK